MVSENVILVASAIRTISPRVSAKAAMGCANQTVPKTGQPVKLAGFLFFRRQQDGNFNQPRKKEKKNHSIGHVKDSMTVGDISSDIDRLAAPQWHQLGLSPG